MRAMAMAKEKSKQKLPPEISYRVPTNNKNVEKIKESKNDDAKIDFYISMQPKIKNDKTALDKKF